MTGTARLLLLSGGLDSAALAYWTRPHHTLFVNYGQRPATAEGAAAAAVARELGLPHSQITIDLAPIGAGLLSGDTELSDAPSPEWWPFRNQLLVSFAAAWVIRNRAQLKSLAGRVEIVVGSVVSDGTRHLDGTEGFYEALDALLARQEGNIGVTASAITLETTDLILKSEVSDRVLGWTHSCHRSDLPCGECPGCYKRLAVLTQLARLV